MKLQRDSTSPSRGEAGGRPAATVSEPVREYLYAEQVAMLTPWTEEALARLIQRGTLRAGVHFFQPTGHRGRRIFKWSAIVALIEGRDREAAPVVRVAQGTKRFDVEKAEEGLRRLLG